MCSPKVFARDVFLCLAIFNILPPLLSAAQNHWNNGIRHNHAKYGYQAQDYWSTKPDRIYGTVPSVPTTGVRQVYHTHQRGSVRIPYGGSARVHNRGRKKMYRGSVTTTILDGQRHLQNYHPHSHKYKYRDQDWELSRDEPVRSNDACAKCPPDRAVIAKRGSTTTLMEKLPIIPCFPWSNIADVRHEIVMGPQPGQPIGEGSHALVTRLYNFERPVATCHARYNVIVRKCEPLELQGGVTANCPLGEAWGGVCHFSCPDGYDLIGANSTECDSQLEWSNDVPQCTVTTSCTLPVTPENGHITCRTPHHKPIRSSHILPDATLCHYWCALGFKIPASQHHLTTVSCMAGQWNSTQDPTCVETNSLQESSSKELSTEKRHRLSSPRLGRKHCPRSKCQNGGRCYVILGEQICMCRQGFTGPTCSEQMTDNAVK
ncbi:P-selectin-like [Nilaparvata lugens]|uniref:P-selectin-like n=1 Tax=Nilaparvata lugens TaxID=108931 RepID=UPI00193E62C6|nr:P-selectin-like [Nilaparvata lugens]